MGRRHVEFIAQLLGSRGGGQILRQGIQQIIIHIGFLLSQAKRDQQHDRDDQDRFVVGRCQLGSPSKLGNQNLMFMLMNRFVKYQNQRRQNDNSGEHAQHNALGHDYAHIRSQL